MEEYSIKSENTAIVTGIAHNARMIEEQYKPNIHVLDFGAGKPMKDDAILAVEVRRKSCVVHNKTN